MTRLSPQEVAQLTLYPNEPRKKLSLIRKELLYLCSRSRRGSWDLQATIMDYFNMGIDRAGEDMRQYVFRTEFDELRNLKQPEAVVLLKDKWVTSNHLRMNGVAVSYPCLYKTPFVSESEALTKLREAAGTRFFAKPVDGTLGVGAFAFEKKGDTFVKDDGTILSGSGLLALLDGYIVEPYIEQHEALQKMYPHAVASLRIVTICENGRIQVILSALLVAAGGNHTSNFHQGGLRIAVDPETGMLRDRGLRTHVNRGWYTEHPDTGVLFKGFKIPYWKEIIDLVMHAHRCFPLFHSVGWDVVVTPSGPIIIEGNHRWVPHSFQYNNGPGRWLMEKYFLK